MPKFFFHYRQDRDFCRDETGIDFDSVEAAYLSAYEGALSMWPELLKERRDLRRCAFDVTNDNGALVFTLPFMEILESCTRESAQADVAASKAFRNILQARRRAQDGFQALQRELSVTREVLSSAKALLRAANAMIPPPDEAEGMGGTR